MNNIYKGKVDTGICLVAEKDHDSMSHLHDLSWCEIAIYFKTAPTSIRWKCVGFQVYTKTGDEMSGTLTDVCVDQIYKDNKHHLTAGDFGTGLQEMMRDYA